jgi:uncharacterized membrane protein
MGTSETQQGAGAPPVLGVLDAYARGWQALIGDLANLWVATFLMWVLILGSSMLIGWIPCFGGILIAVFVQAPLWVGWYRTLELGLGRGRADIAEIFDGFKERYWTSVLAMLIPVVVLTVASILVSIGLFGGLSLTAALAGEEEPAVLIVPIVAYVLLCALISLVVWTLFLLVPLAVWDHPESGWEAVRESVGLVGHHLLQAIAYVLLMALIYTVAAIVGALVCCVGVLFTVPFAQAWSGLALVLLYRSWTGRPIQRSAG